VPADVPRKAVDPQPGLLEQPVEHAPGEGAMRATTLQCETHQKGARSTGAWEGRWASRYGAGTATLRGRSVSSAIGALFLSRSRCSSYPMTASPGRTDGQREARVDGVLDHAYAAFLSPVALSDSYRSPATARRWSISGDGDPFRSRATWNSVCSAMPHAQQTRLRSWLLQPCSHRLPAHRRFRPRHRFSVCTCTARWFQGVWRG
jgi:hypothetical protein